MSKLRHAKRVMPETGRFTSHNGYQSDYAVGYAIGSDPKTWQARGDRESLLPMSITANGAYTTWSRDMWRGVRKAWKDNGVTHVDSDRPSAGIRALKTEQVRILADMCDKHLGIDLYKYLQDNGSIPELVRLYNINAPSRR